MVARTIPAINRETGRDAAGAVRTNSNPFDESTKREDQGFGERPRTSRAGQSAGPRAGLDLKTCAGLRRFEIASLVWGGDINAARRFSSDA